MLRVAALAGAVILSASCNRSESSEGLGPAPAAGSAKPGSASGFSADLAKDLAATKAPESPGSGSSGSGSADTRAADRKPEAAGSGDAKPAAAEAKIAAADSKATSDA